MSMTDTVPPSDDSRHAQSNVIEFERVSPKLISKVRFTELHKKSMLNTE
jgi:hypothetical protein